MSLNNELYIVRPTLIGLNPAEPNYYSLMISLDTRSGSYNAVTYLQTYVI